MEGFAVTCPLAPDASRLISSFCSSPRGFVLCFLRTPPRGDALALRLPFGSAHTWDRDFHPAGFVPCTAHTLLVTGLPEAGPVDQRVRRRAPLRSDLMLPARC